MSRADTLPTMPVQRSDSAVSRSLAVLIEVPEVKDDRLRPVRTRVAGHLESRRPRAGRPKRRLRREVRVAGCALLTLAPLLSACTLGWSSRPTRILACAITDATARDRGPGDSALPRVQASGPGVPSIGSSGVVVLSIEPAVYAPGTGTEVPVIFPGYVLPDDNLEGPAHEGS
jgi:hypothetical protein